MDIVGRKGRLKHLLQEPSHFVLVEWRATLHRRSAGISHRKALQPVGPPREAPASEIGDELGKTGSRIEPRMGRRHGVDHDGSTSEWRYLISHTLDPLLMQLDHIEFLIGEIERDG
jgi:hypothetical protein